jgi:hypothetical protein
VERAVVAKNWAAAARLVNIRLEENAIFECLNELITHPDVAPGVAGWTSLFDSAAVAVVAILPLFAIRCCKGDELAGGIPAVFPLVLFVAAQCHFGNDLPICVVRESQPRSVGAGERDDAIALFMSMALRDVWELCGQDVDGRVTVGTAVASGTLERSGQGCSVLRGCGIDPILAGIDEIELARSAGTDDSREIAAIIVQQVSMAA